MELTPREIVQELDRYIIGQEEAKRAVAIALRNRYRRAKLPPELREEVMPKNILMIGPTGVGKTEIARRLARLASAPFVKVEATKFTEVGYVGRDVESAVRELVDAAIRMVKEEKMRDVAGEAERMAEDRIIDLFVPPPKRAGASNPLSLFWGMAEPKAAEPQPPLDEDKRREERERYRKLLRLGELENHVVELEIEEQRSPFMELLPGSGLEDLGASLNEALGSFLPKKRVKRKLTVAEARNIILQEEAGKLLDMDAITREAISRAEESGIIFIDEIDKVVGTPGGSGPDVSREGVQRDILPIVEGSTVITKVGPVRTDHMLFIAAGAFHVSKPSDLIPELQGRFPIRVNLESLRPSDFARILTEPQNSLTKQYTALLATENIQLQFTEDGISAIAQWAAEVNSRTENIGARRLHTIMEKILEDVSFTADGNPRQVVIDEPYVRSKLQPIAEDDDLSRYIL
ncbi:MAG: Clp protease ATPase [Peptococcaceae bacterium 1109]|nr:MAG: Clp protease ATPase [Peptococcaceae bacterium 1109]